MPSKKETIKVDKEDFMMLCKKVSDLERASKPIVVDIVEEAKKPDTLDYIFECIVKYSIPPLTDPKVLAIELQPKIEEFKVKVDQLMREYKMLGVNAIYLKVW